MKLSAAFIVDQLKKSYDISITKNISLSPLITRPSLAYPGMIFEDNIVYIIDKELISMLEVYAVLPEHCLFIVMGCKTNVKSSNICYLYGTGNKIEVFANVQMLFDTYAKWQDNLIDIYFKEKSIHELLSASLPVLNNSLEVVGMDFFILASASSFPLSRDEKIFGSSDATLSFVTELKNSKLYYEVREMNGAFYFPSSITGMASLCVNIKQNGKTTYRLIMLENSRPIKKSEGFLLEFLALIIENTLNHNMAGSISRSNKVLNRIFENVLMNKAADYVKISQRLDAEGWYPHHEYICIYLELSKLDKQNETYNPIMNYINNIFTHCCPIIYNENVVVYVNMTLSKMQTSKLVGIMEIFAGENYLNVGISRSMSGHMSLRRQYIQALNALSIGSRKFPEKLVHEFNDISFDYIMQQATKNLPGYMICHEKILKLEQNDKNKNTEYMKTLRTFLDNQCNVLGTANKLFIHRSTLLYRLNKIKDILESDLKNPDEILYFMLSFHLIDIEEVKDNLYKI